MFLISTKYPITADVSENGFRPLYGVPNFYVGGGVLTQSLFDVFVPSTGFLISTGYTNTSAQHISVFVPSTGFLISTQLEANKEVMVAVVFVPSTGFLISTVIQLVYM